MAYPGDGSQGGQGAPWVGPPAGQRDPGAGVALAAEGLTWLQRNLGANFGAGLYDQSLFYKKVSQFRLCTLFYVHFI